MCVNSVTVALHLLYECSYKGHTTVLLAALSHPDSTSPHLYCTITLTPSVHYLNCTVCQSVPFAVSVKVLLHAPVFWRWHLPCLLPAAYSICNHVHLLECPHLSLWGYIHINICGSGRFISAHMFMHRWWAGVKCDIVQLTGHHLLQSTSGFVAAEQISVVQLILRGSLSLPLLLAHPLI